MQGVHSNYEIDLFRNLLAAVGDIAGIKGADAQLANASVRVIADHIRSSAFLIADGVMPGNEDRSYVLRRIIRRGLRHGHMLNIREPFFHKLVAPLAREMGDAYPLLRERQADVEAALLREERRFAETLSQGMDLLDATIADLPGKVIPGNVVFQLYDTFGFPTDLTADVARERGLTVDMDGFEAAMNAQRDRGRAAARFSAAIGQRVHTKGKVEFLGYAATRDAGAVVALFDADGREAGVLKAGEEGIVVLDRTPFYAESGGQVGDAGVLEGEGIRFEVTDTQASGDQHLHIGRLVSGEIHPGARLTASVDEERRRRIRLNHSATHLMHAALRNVLGTHVQQKGSLVTAERLRFDFSHSQPLSAAELAEIETQVNAEIQRNTAIDVELLGYQEAIGRGAMALFGEKYGDSVRVLTMGGGYSVELCGGTHASRTGDIGLFRVVSETGVAAGVRRIEAVTGPGALEWARAAEDLIERIGAVVKGSRADLGEKVSAIVEENRRLARELDALKQKLAAAQGADLSAQAIEVAGVKVLAAQIDGGADALLQTLDALKAKLQSAVIVLGTVEEGKVSLIAGVTKDVASRIKAPDLIKLVGTSVGAKGGGRPDMARAGGGDKPDALGAALQQVSGWVAGQLG
jgi:alanyl-tRNA synthetase